MDSTNDLLQAYADAMRPVEHAPDLESLARAVGIFPASRLALLSLEEGFPEPTEAGYSTRAVREWLATKVK